MRSITTEVSSICRSQPVPAAQLPAPGIDADTAAHAHGGGNPSVSQ